MRPPGSGGAPASAALPLLANAQRHCLRRGAWQLPARRSERDPYYDSDRLLVDAAAFHWVITHRWAPLSSSMIGLSHGAPQRSASFPSTHAATSFAGAYALSRLFPTLRLPLWILACLVAYSRVYVGVHYPLDVIGGAVVGLAAAAFVVDGTRWYSDQLAARHSLAAQRPNGPAH